MLLTCTRDLSRYTQYHVRDQELHADSSSPRESSARCTSTGRFRTFAAATKAGSLAVGARPLRIWKSPTTSVLPHDGRRLDALPDARWRIGRNCGRWK